MTNSKLSAAYAVRHYAQHGSGTYADSPGSFRERLLSVACSQPCGDSLHLESFSVSRGRDVGIQGGGLNMSGRVGWMLFSGMWLESPGDRLFAAPWFSVRLLSC